LEAKPLPIGIEDFERVIHDNYYYVDKTLFIRELLDRKALVNLFTRPRRFGKSLNLSMLQHFFEISQDSTSLFKKLKIMNTGEKYLVHMNRYPVIILSLKAADQNNFDDSFFMLKEMLQYEFRRHRYLLTSTHLSEEIKLKYQAILTDRATDQMYNSCLKILSECLEQHYNEKVVILIDEYDVPLEKSYFNGYYDKMVNFIRSFFGSALKTNNSLKFAVLTGCLRISKESIFTGLNNLYVNAIDSDRFETHFGFTPEEVKALFTFYHLDEKLSEAEQWYNGYVFGQAHIYNPWSIIHYASDHLDNAKKFPKPYWSNTSSNDIIRDLIEVSNEEAKAEIEALIRGGSVTKPVHDDIVYSDIRQNRNNIWNFLFFTGYLKKEEESMVDGTNYYTMKIPNEELRYIYVYKIREWFEEKVRIVEPSILRKAIVDGDAKTVSWELNKRLANMISFHDTAENFYHGFLLGILSNISGYSIKSNRESGKGRSDIYMRIRGSNHGAAIFELKTAKKRGQMDTKCDEALKQIADKQYVHELEEDGYENVMQYGVAFFEKECLVKFFRK
jgi:hypothetical protein